MLLLKNIWFWRSVSLSQTLLPVCMVIDSNTYCGWLVVHGLLPLIFVDDTLSAHPCWIVVFASLLFSIYGWIAIVIFVRHLFVGGLLCCRSLLLDCCCYFIHCTLVLVCKLVMCVDCCCFCQEDMFRNIFV